MAALNGFNILTARRTLTGNPNLSTAHEGWGRDFLATAIFVIAQDTAGGLLTCGRRAAPWRSARLGVHIPAYRDDFYYRIRLVPSALNLGNVASDTSASFIVWNAFFVAVSIDSIAAVDLDGVALVGETAPTTMPAIAVLTYDALVSLGGPAVIDGRFEFVVDGVTYLLPVTGSRVLVLAHEANWEQPVKEALEWLNPVLGSLSGPTQVSSARSKPRRSFEYEVVELDSQQRPDNVLFASMWRNCLIAVPTDYVELATPIAVNDTTVAVTGDTYKSLHDGGLALVFIPGQRHEALEVLTYTAGLLTLSRPAQQSWPLTAFLMPAVYAKPPSVLTTGRITQRYTRFSPSWLCDPVQTVANLPVIAAPESYDGFELYVVEPDRSIPNNLSFAEPYSAETIDNNTGAIVYDTDDSRAAMARTFGWQFRDRAAMNAFRGFLARRDGRRVPVYMPTWQDDFTLVQDITAVDGGIRLADNGHVDTVNVDPARAHILIMTQTGAYYPRRLSAPVKNGDGTVTFAIDAPLGVSLAIADVQTIYLLPLWRMSSLVEFTWHSSTVAECEIAFEVENV